LPFSGISASATGMLQGSWLAGLSNGLFDSICPI